MRALVLLAALTGCTEYNYTQRTNVDVFEQNTRQAVDLLVVIDNSCSMVEEQENLATNFDSLIGIFEGADVDWRLGVTTTDAEPESLGGTYVGLLVAGDDEIIIEGPRGEIDRVEYTREWDFHDGYAIQLDRNSFDASNDSRSKWCEATDMYNDSSYGNPGEINYTCDGSAEEDWEDDDGVDDGPVAPGGGDLIVTEIMAQSIGQDSLCEWVEITNLTSDTLDLSGVSLLDDGRNEAELGDVQLGPHEALVIGRSTDTSLNCDTPVDVALETGFTLFDNSPWIDVDTVDAGELFSEMVAQGTTGTGIEQGFEAARMVFEEPYWSTYNEGFLREDANFSMLFVSDEDDVSPWAVHDYLNYFAGLKGDAGYRDHGVFNVSAVVGDEPPDRDDLPACSSDNGEAYYGRRYLEAANITEGLIESICEEDFAPIVTELGLTLSGLALTFELSESCDPTTLVVSLYETADNDSLVEELVKDEDYTYNSETNSLEFTEEQVPPSDYFIVAEYRVLATGASVSDTGSTR